MVGYKREYSESLLVFHTTLAMMVFRTNDGHCFPVHLLGTKGIRFPVKLLLSVPQIPKERLRLPSPAVCIRDLEIYMGGPSARLFG
eukprot:1089171-Pelagomonas_calceolata.AAC.1